tara:strand:- start:675 stop:869 length:195 start_codon:yes stop_codon:yes gene_type:complete
MSKTIQVKELEVGDSIIGPDTGNELVIKAVKQSVVFGWNAYSTEYGQLYLDPEAEIEIFWTEGS